MVVSCNSWSCAKTRSSLLMAFCASMPTILLACLLLQAAAFSPPTPPTPEPLLVGVRARADQGVKIVECIVYNAHTGAARSLATLDPS